MTRAVEISRAFLRHQPASAARALDSLAPADVAAFIGPLDEGEVAAVLARMQPSRAAAVLEELLPDKAAALLHQVPSHARGLLMRSLRAESQQAVLRSAPRRQAAALSRYLSYDPGAVGAWMDAPEAVFGPETTVAACIEQLRGLGQRLGSTVFVVAKEQRLLGTIELHTLLPAPEEATLGSIMRRNVVALAPQASLASVVALEAWDSTLALPVVQRQRLVGSLRFESLRMGLDIQHRTSGGLGVNVVTLHLAQAFLVSFSGLLQVATREPELSRLSGNADSR